VMDRLAVRTVLGGMRPAVLFEFGIFHKMRSLSDRERR
jgi:hypothetical protein